MAQSDYFSSLPFKLIRRRWLVITPIVMVMSLVFSYTRSVDLYRSTAIVTFQTEYLLADSDQSLKNLFEEKVGNVVSSLRFGDSVRRIVQKAWPNIDPHTDPVAFNAKAGRLGSRNGVDLAFRRDNYRALNIAYTSEDPDEAYRVVQATIDTLIEQSKQLSERRVANSETFLREEIADYKARLDELDQEITRLENGLRPLDGESASSSYDGSELITDAGLLKEQLKYREGLPQLEFDLKVAEKELARLVAKLESGSYLTDGEELEGLLSVGDDYLLKELRETIVQKEKQRHILASQGFLARHPKRKSLDAEIRNLRKLEKERLQELSAEADAQSSEMLKLRLEKELRAKIGAKTEEITRIRDRMAVLEGYQSEIEAQKDKFVSQIDVLAAQRSRLEQLKQLKIVTAEAYTNAVAELDVIRRKGRADEGDIGLRIEIAEAPSVPKGPIPLAHMGSILMGFAISIGLGVGLVCVIDVVDTSIESGAELRRLTDIPVLGEIDRMVTEEMKSREKGRKIALLVFLALFVLASDELVTRFYL